MSVSQLPNQSEAQAKRYLQRGFRVLTTALSHRSADDLAKSLGVAGMALESLAKRIDEGNRSGVPFFDRPTVVLLALPENLSASSDVQLESVRTAAQRSPCEIILQACPAPAFDTQFSTTTPRSPKP